MSVLSHTNTNINQMLFNIPESMQKSEAFSAKQRQFLHGMHDAASSLDRAGLSELRSLPKPPQLLEKILVMVVFILESESKPNAEQFTPKSDRTWMPYVARRLCEPNDLIDGLNNYSVGTSFTRDVYDEIISDWKEIINVDGGRPRVQRMSVACAPLFDWLECVIDYFELAMINQSETAHHH